ncbi:MAG: AraC family transcriptional regulator [Deltaproteobacteria bacterium]
MSARLYRPIALALSARGIDADVVFAEFGMPSPATAGWDVRMPLPQIAGIWARLLEVTGDPHFALRAAEHVDLTTCDVITYLESAAATLREALAKKFAYLPLMTDAVEWTLEEHGDEVSLTLHERPARPPLAPVAEYLLAARHVFLRQFGPEQWTLTQVSFRHEPPPSASEHRRLFGVEPSFRSAYDRLSFSGAWLNAPMRGRDAALTDLLSRYAEQLLPEFALPPSWQERVRQNLAGGRDPGVVTVARALGVSSRSLQRALAEEGTTYAEVLNRQRQALAERLLRRRELGISEISLALGFSGSPAFHRAFRRWTGVSPSQFRARALGPSFSEPQRAALHEMSLHEMSLHEMSLHEMSLQ